MVNKPHTKLTYLGTLPEEPRSNSHTKPMVSKDDEIVRPSTVVPGSMIEKSTSENLGSVCLIAMPNSSMRRPATNVDQMMTTFVDEPKKISI